MSVYDDYITSLLPGNYALTKSMELTKESYSGTLWYTKKYLVLYYYVFLSNDIMTDEYISKVKASFDSYISTIDESIREDALDFFYPNDDSRNFRSDNFKSFMNFANKLTFANQEEKNRYYNNAKKCYFAILMGTGGQAGVKEKVVSAVKAQGFNYSQENMRNLILNSVAEICAEKANCADDFYRGDIPRIVSLKAKSEIISTASSEKLSKEKVVDIIKKYPCSEIYPAHYGQDSNVTRPQYSGIENDCFASIRNERQILYYYGYFHSKTTGATEFEFSSLTPVGELALKANSIEFLAIWEHQKLKMISQPATADINNLSKKIVNPDCFSISFTPYTDIIGYILRNNSLSTDEYKYIVSRRSHLIDEVSWEENETIFKSNLSSIKSKVNAFGRKSDIDTYDGSKELKKYILGIRCDLKKDCGTNILNIVSYDGSKVNIHNEKSLNQLYSIYRRVDDYKSEKYMSIYESSEKDLRQRYCSLVRGTKKAYSPVIKIHWDLYNIHVDRFIMLSILMTFYCIKFDLDIDNLSKENLIIAFDFIFKNYRNILKSLGLKTEKQVKTEINSVVKCIQLENYSPYTCENESDSSQSVGKYKQDSASDLFEKIEQTSFMSSVSIDDDRIRNGNLINMIKSYYLICFADEKGMLKCECCGNETFITGIGEPYLEFHHLIPFSIAFGPDHYLNLFALCPNCHRKIHYLSVSQKEIEYRKLNNNNYFHKTFVDRLKSLKSLKLLRSYHLEYLLADNAITAEEYDSIAA